MACRRDTSRIELAGLLPGEYCTPRCLHEEAGTEDVVGLGGWAIAHILS